MKTSLRILHLEDNLNDADLIRETLAVEGINCDMVRVETRSDFIAALEQGRFDIILSDYSLPSFDGISALAIVREKYPDLPFILVSGKLGEEPAIETLKKGATDFVLKEHLTRLVPSVRRALKEAEERAERKSAEEARTKLETQLRQSQKLEAIGQLAGGVAHDFNNILMGITSYCELLLMKLAPESPFQREVTEILNAAETGASLTRQLLAFSRKQVLEPKILDLNHIVSNMLSMLQRLISEDIELSLILSDELGRVRTDLGQIEQVVLNLAINARDAMPQGGKLTIQTANIELDHVYTDHHTNVIAGRYIMLAVNDTGCGMDEVTKSRIFEPFFTTKEPGKGTGLGLSTVYGIVKQSDGYIEAYSEPGKGSAFKIYLPRIDEPEDAKSVGEKTLPSVLGWETLLLVDDNEIVRTAIGSFLTMMGYAVLSAGNAKEALELSQRHNGLIHLLLTDVVMPGMGGSELAERILSERPLTKVIYMSGYIEETVRLQSHFQPGTFLQKPASMPVLIRKIREMLDAK